MPGRFIDVPLELGEWIAAAIKRFADDHHLNCVLWHEDEHIWFVEQERDYSSFSCRRRVQITPYWDPGSERGLYFVPQIFVMPKDRRVIKTLKQVNKDHIRSLSMLELPRNNMDEVHRKVSRELLSVWEIVQKYDPDAMDFDEVVQRTSENG